MSLRRLRPLGDYLSFRDAVDSVFDPTHFGGLLGRESGVLPLDVVVREDEIVVQASVPGFEPANIAIDVQGDLLTLSGRHDVQQARRNERYYLQERRVGSFQRVVRLPALVDAENAQAEIRNGLLTLRLPRISPGPQTRKIKVKTGAQGTDAQAPVAGAPDTTDVQVPTADATTTVVDVEVTPTEGGTEP